MLLDCGINHKTPEIIEAEQFSTKAMISKGKHDVFKDAESAFIVAEKADGQKAYQNNLSTTARIYRPGRFPLTPQDIIQSGNQTKYEFKMLDGGLSDSGDMGYIYGTVTLKAGDKLTTSNYLRVWKLEKNKWKIVIDVINA